MRRRKDLLLCAMLLLLAIGMQAQTRGLRDLAQGFMSPPDSIRPYVYWYWINDHISPLGVVQDLEAMKRAGIGGAFIGNIGLTPEEGTSYGDVKLFSPRWWDAVEAAMETAGKLDITIGMFNSPGWSQSGGPWVKPEAAMRFIASDVEHVSGGRRIVRQTKKANTDSVYLFTSAFPAVAGSRFDIMRHEPTLTTQEPLENTYRLMDGDFEKTVSIPADGGTFTVDIAFAKPFPARSLVLYPSRTAFSATITLQALRGEKTETIVVSDFNRSNTSLQTGFDPQAPLSISLPATNATAFRLLFTNITGAPAFSEITLSPMEVLDHYSEKQLAKMHSTPLPLWDAYRWKPQAEPNNVNGMVDPARVIQLHNQVRADGRLEWDVPKGDWTIVHHYAVPTGVTNSPASAEGTGLEIDKMDADKLPQHFDAFIGQVLKRIPAAKRRTFKYMVADSYEVGGQNWVDDFQRIFMDVYRYDPLPYLPVLSGLIVGSADQSNRFLWDLRRLVADRVATEYVGGLRKLGNRHGLKLWLENYGHWGFPSEFLKYGGQSDEIAGEFWNEGNLGNIENRAASSAAHIYGKKRVWAESFTAGGGEFSRYPALLKRRGDWVFTEGVNQTLLHLYIHQLDEKNDPGINAWFSTEFNRKNTWFNASNSYIDYIRRCNYLLQQGASVNDIAYFIGEDAPIMTGIRQPERPLGYDYDYINADVIQHMYVKENTLCLPSGPAYRILVIPPSADMRPAVLAKIKELVRDGAVILGDAPSRSPSLENYPFADEEIRRDATLLWDSQEIKPGIRRFGKGLVMSGITLEHAFAHVGLKPDLETDVGESISYTHRRTPEQDIYFISNQAERKIEFTAIFRIASGLPYWFNPVTGEMHALSVTNRAEGRTSIAMMLDVNESGFVIFDKHHIKNSIADGVQNFPEPYPIKKVDGAWSVQFRGIDRDGTRDSIVTFEKLLSWADHSDTRIRDFSGTAIYTNHFDLKQPDANERIYLETAPIVGLATVRVNGESVGTIWTAPWRIDISNAVKAGENKIEIDIVSTWKNRLIAESKLPSDKRSLHVEINNYTADSAYDRSGLIGPVIISAKKTKGNRRFLPKTEDVSFLYKKKHPIPKPY